MVQYIYIDNSIIFLDKVNSIEAEQDTNTIMVRFCDGSTVLYNPDIKAREFLRSLADTLEKCR